MSDNFTNKLKDILNNPPDIPMNEQAWNAMENRLDQNQGGHKFGKWVYAIPLILLWALPLIFSGFLYQNLNKANNQIELLQNEMDNRKVTTADSFSTSKPVIVYDTVYRTVIIDEEYFVKNNVTNEAKKITSSIYKPVSSDFVNATSFLYSDISLLQPHRSNWGPISTQPGGALIMKQENSNNLAPGNEEKSMEESSTNLVTSPIHSIRLTAEHTSPMAELPLLDVHVQKRRKRYLKAMLMKMQPTTFALGASAGWISVPGYSKNKALDITAAINGEIGYSKNFSLLLGAEYLNWSFQKEIEEDEEEEDELEGYPDIPPRFPGDLLHEIYGEFSYLQFPVGLKYTFLPQNRISPYFGIGVSTQRVIRSKLTYDYLSIMEEYQVSRHDLLRSEFQLNSIWTTIGGQIYLNDHWRLLLEGSMQMDINKGTYEFEDPQVIKINSGLQYLF